MCSIVIATEHQRLEELLKLNSNRGTHSHSVTFFKKENNEFVSQYKKLGSLNPSTVKIPVGCFVVIHQQAPTTGARDEKSVHPSIFYKTHLWHNGILKDSTIKMLQNKHGLQDVWDTRLMHVDLFIDGFKSLDKLDGSFACVFYNGKDIYIFRNMLAPLHVSADYISSTSFLGSYKVAPEEVFKLSVVDNMINLEGIHKFKTVNNPYYFEGMF